MVGIDEILVFVFVAVGLEFLGGLFLLEFSTLSAAELWFVFSWIDLFFFRLFFL